MMPGNPLDLSGRCILVTGASSGIGRETAILISSLNARVILAGRDEKRLAATLAQMSGSGHVVSPFDLGSTDEIAGWMKTVTAQTGPLQGLVHAAGKQFTAPTRMMSTESVNDVLRTNLTSALMLAKGFCQKSCRTPGASLVFVASVMGLVGAPGIAAYAASKSALIGMTRSIALELAPEKIRVNCVAPAFVQTEMLEQVRQRLTPEQFAALERSHPLGFGTPADVAHAIAFLLADTSKWITGSTMVVDGGYSIQ